MKWTGPDYQRVESVYTRLWREAPADDEFREFADECQMRKVPPQIADQAIRKAKHYQIDPNFRPSHGTFFAHIEQLMPTLTHSPLRPETTEPTHKPCDLSQKTRDEDPGPVGDWLRELHDKRLRAPGVKQAPVVISAEERKAMEMRVMRLEARRKARVREMEESDSGS